MKDEFAFPRVTQLGQQAPGMELRDWFAGIALSGMLANSARIGDSTTGPEDYANWAYETADAMISQRNKEQN